MLFLFINVHVNRKYSLRTCLKQVVKGQITHNIISSIVLDFLNAFYIWKKWSDSTHLSEFHINFNSHRNGIFTRWILLIDIDENAIALNVAIHISISLILLMLTEWISRAPYHQRPIAIYFMVELYRAFHSQFAIIIEYSRCEAYVFIGCKRPCSSACGTWSM